MTRTDVAESIETPMGWAVATAALLLSTIAMAGGMMLLFLAMKAIAAEFGWPRQYPALALGLAMLSGGVGGVVLSRYTDRHGVDVPLIAVTLSTGIGLLAMAWIDAAWQMFLLHAVLLGIFGPSAGFVFLVTVVSRWFDRNRGSAVGMVISGQSIAGVVGPLAAGYALDAFGWRLTYWLAGLIVLFGSLACAAVVRRPPPPLKVPVATGDGRAPATLKPTVLRLPVLYALLGAAIISCCVPMAVGMGHLVSHATDLGYPAVQAAELFAAVMGISAISRLGAGWLADRIGGIPALFLTSGAQAVGCLFFALVEGLAGLYLAALIYGLGTGGVIVCYAVIIREFFPARNPGGRIGTLYSISTLGMAFGGWVAGPIFDHAGSYAPAFWLAFGFNILNLVLIGVVQACHWRGRAVQAPAVA
ncbi:MAG: MFS transporter [Alphaproteobacteria bacterium]|nr:MFS transporter [Alphaproteobacteria bacterium]